MSAGYELVDHTADIVVRAYGASPEHVFEQAALATVSLLYDPATARSRERIPVQVRAADVELLLAAWLNELLFLIEARRLVLARFEVESLRAGALLSDAAPGGRTGIGGAAAGRTNAAGAISATSAAPGAWLRATAVGEAFDGRRHAVRSVVKAATLHDLSLRRLPEGWEGRVLLDV